MEVYEDDIVGFCFLPSGPELISEFLVKKVVGLPLSRNIIHDDIDVYLYHPDQLPIPNCEDRDWAYFFLFRAPEEEEFRPTPYGYWEEIKSEKEYNYESWRRAIGFRKTFAFYEGEVPNGKMTDWRMKEYRLNRELSVFKNPKDPKMKNCVVCKVFKKVDIPDVPMILYDSEEFSESEEEDDK
ncbi:NAC domain-containing protein 22-like isoform X1 [Typha latifolia]|uniref:NAC domain-containing protein 22-like isoform X1 n=1 Tax=Typha latifolia TaxID=4733 RepID=UPI003C309D86